MDEITNILENVKATFRSQFDQSSQRREELAGLLIIAWIFNDFKFSGVEKAVADLLKGLADYKASSPEEQVIFGEISYLFFKRWKRQEQ